MIKNQLTEMSTRLDNLESSLRKDIHSILDLLHQQQQMQLHQPQAMSQQLQGRQIIYKIEININCIANENIFSDQQLHINRPSIVIFRLII